MTEPIENNSDSESYYFSSDEFEEGGGVEKLLATINGEIIEGSDRYSTFTLNTLNEVLMIPNLYELLKKQKNIETKNEEVTGLIKTTESYRSSCFSDLDETKKANIIYLNRLLLQRAYPDICPKLLSMCTPSVRTHIRANKTVLMMLCGGVVVLLIFVGIGFSSTKSQSVTIPGEAVVSEHIVLNGQNDSSDNELEDTESALDTVDGTENTASAEDVSPAADNADQKQIDESYVTIDAGVYQIPPHLTRYFKQIKYKEIVIDQPFSIQSSEVSVGEFRQYLESLDKVAKEAVGRFWAEDLSGNSYPDNRPVDYISREEAVDYANWLSRRNGWDMKLPTVRQWVASVIVYGEDEPILASEDNTPYADLRSMPDHLIGNLREWSSEQCGDKKHLLLGEDYMTNKEALGELPCVNDSGKWKGAGFRLVRSESITQTKKE